MTESSSTGSGLHRLEQLALASYVLLFALSVAWEGWLAPKSSPLFWLAVKGLPLLWLLPGVFHHRPRSLVFASLLALLYLTEGLVLIWTEHASGWRLSSTLPWATMEMFLALTFMLSATYAVRLQRRRGASLDR